MKTKILHIRCASPAVEAKVLQIIRRESIPENVMILASVVMQNPFWKRLDEIEIEVFDL